MSTMKFDIREIGCQLQGRITSGFMGLRVDDVRLQAYSGVLSNRNQGVCFSAGASGGAGPQPEGWLVIISVLQ